MNYLLDKEFPFGLKLLSLKDISEIGLEIIGNIDATYIDRDSGELEALFKKINDKCINKRLWVLLGSKDNKKWLPIQLGSVSAKNSDIRSEIKTDFRRMIPFNPQIDVKEWKSNYYGAIMEVEIGRDTVCQKYAKLREKCPFFAIAILDKEEYCEEDISIISKYQKKELELAEKLKPLIWNPSPKEKKYIKESE